MFCIRAPAKGVSGWCGQNSSGRSVPMHRGHSTTCIGFRKNAPYAIAWYRIHNFTNCLHKKRLEVQLEGFCVLPRHWRALHPFSFRVLDRAHQHHSFESYNCSKLYTKTRNRHVGKQWPTCTSLCRSTAPTVCPLFCAHLPDDISYTTSGSTKKAATLSVH